MIKKFKSKIESKLKESEIRYRRLFETAHDGILILNSETGQITDVNPFLEKLLGYSKSEFLDKKLWEVGPFKNIKVAKDTFKILQKKGYVRYEDLPLETKDGRSVDVEFVSNSYVAGDQLVIQCNIRDITARKRLEYIKEKNRIVFGKVNLKTLVTKVVERCKALAYKKNISITNKNIPNVTFFGDRIYLEKMLVNLIKNSIVYGNKGGHTKILAKKSDGFIVIDVIDDGIGISKEDLPHVFERFYRADKSHASSGNSIGLGLAIVKWVAEIHGGTVEVKNIKNKTKGSVFTISLPIKGA